MVEPTPIPQGHNVEPKDSDYRYFHTLACADFGYTLLLAQVDKAGDRLFPDTRTWISPPQWRARRRTCAVNVERRPLFKLPDNTELYSDVMVSPFDSTKSARVMTNG